MGAPLRAQLGPHALRPWRRANAPGPFQVRPPSTDGPIDPARVPPSVLPVSDSPFAQPVAFGDHNVVRVGGRLTDQCPRGRQADLAQLKKPSTITLTVALNFSHEHEPTHPVQA
jgi:hypothetical protein